MGSGSMTPITSGAASGNYIEDTDVDNWAGGATTAQKLEVIKRIEVEIERLTKDVFYEMPFDIFRDGPGSDVMPLNLRGRLLSISAIYLLGVALNTSTYTHTANVLHKDDSGITTDDYLRWLEKRARRRGDGLFVSGEGNYEIVGTMGWPEILAYDTLVGTFRTRETITGGANSYTAKIQRVTPTALWITGKTGNYNDDEQIVGGTSGATAAVNSADGAVSDPPNGIKESCIMLARWDNDSTLYERYEEGSQAIAGVSYSNQRKPLTGIREIDRILRNFVRKIPKVGVV